MLYIVIFLVGFQGNKIKKNVMVFKNENELMKHFTTIATNIILKKLSKAQANKKNNSFLFQTPLIAFVMSIEDQDLNFLVFSIFCPGKKSKKIRFFLN